VGRRGPAPKWNTVLPRSGREKSEKISHREGVDMKTEGNVRAVPNDDLGRSEGGVRKKEPGGNLEGGGEPFCFD